MNEKNCGVIRLGMMDEFFRIASQLKHEKFYEEEWRFINTGLFKLPLKSVQFRVVKSMIIPYLSVELSKNIKNLPIKRIIIGPGSRDKNLIRLAIEHILRINDIIDCEVVISPIPYISE